MLSHYSHLVSFGMPLLLCIFGITMVLLVGLIGRLYTDSSREWWSREGRLDHHPGPELAGTVRGRVLRAAALFWINAHAPAWGAAMIASGWLGTTIAGVRGRCTAGPRGSRRRQLPGSSSSRKLRRMSSRSESSRRCRRSCTLASVPTRMRRHGREDANLPEYLDRYLRHRSEQPAATCSSIMAAFLVVGLLLAWRVDINKFSLYMMYRNRLVRAYLGASSRNRRPHPFTAFDPKDDPRLRGIVQARRRNTCRSRITSSTLRSISSRARNSRGKRARRRGFVFTPAFCGFEMPSMPYAGGPTASRTCCTRLLQADRAVRRQAYARQRRRRRDQARAWRWPSRVPRSARAWATTRRRPWPS